MGVDCSIHLPGNVRVRDVADVIGILAGKKVVSIGSEIGSLNLRVEGVKIETTCVPEMVQITVEGPLGEDARNARNARNDNESAFCYFHFEGEDKFADWRGLNPKSTPFWCAVAKGLVDFFGGRVDYNDSDSKDCDYKRCPRSNLENNPSNDPAWSRFQRRKLALQPLTAKDFKLANKVSAHKLEPLD